MSRPSQPPEKIELIRLALMVGVDANGDRWTSKRLAIGLGVPERTVEWYRQRIVKARRSIRSTRRQIKENGQEIRDMIGID